MEASYKIRGLFLLIASFVALQLASATPGHVDWIGDNTLIGELLFYPMFRVLVLAIKFFNDYPLGVTNANLNSPAAEYQIERLASGDFALKVVPNTIRSLLIGSINQQTDKTKCDYRFGNESRSMNATNCEYYFSPLANRQCPDDVTGPHNAVQFHVVSAKNPEDQPIIGSMFDGPATYASLYNLDTTHDTVTYILIHGAMERFVGTNNSWMEKMRKMIASRSEKANVIILDWGTRSFNFAYSKLVADARVVAEELLVFLMALHEQKQVKYKQMRLVGFNVGAQIAGVAGMLLFR